MAKLSLSLEEGFEDDHVVVTVGGRSVLDARGVSTRYQISLACLEEIELADGEDELFIALPERGLEARVQLGPTPPNHVRASVSRDGRSIETSTEDPIGFA